MLPQSMFSHGLLALVVSFLSNYHVKCQSIDNLQVLESLSELALLRYHPQLLQASASLNQSFTTLIEDLKNKNIFPAESHDFNCSANLKGLPDSLCRSDALSKCLSVDEMLQLVPKSTKSIGEVVARLCPLLLLQLHSNTCSNNLVPPDNVKVRPNSSAVWGYGLLFVTLISCCSLVGVLILPFLGKKIYHTVLMLFEGLAVGSLAGSSLFHLIPQTFHLIGQDREHGYLWKSLIMFGGIYLFYLSERIMKIIIFVKERKKKMKCLSLDMENSTEPLKSLTDIRKESFPNNIKLDNCHNEKTNNGRIPSKEHLNPQNGYAGLTKDTSNGSEVKMQEYDNSSLNHHHHDHMVHFEKGESAISTVAWMIIFGDGLHNFIDGLSIGAAFSESILAGISISLAVVCEEFPHELGDFAVLLSAGMTMRQALLYNFLSAITCYGGLVFGILLGDLAEGSPYIFALAAGMFLYISLVDMMGELSQAITEAQKDGVKAQLKVFLLHNIGILAGVVILFVMARYQEHFNFGGQTNSPGNTAEEHMKAFYSGVQEVKHLHTTFVG